MEIDDLLTEAEMMEEVISIFRKVLLRVEKRISNLQDTSWNLVKKWTLLAPTLVVQGDTTQQQQKSIAFWSCHHLVT